MTDEPNHFLRRSRQTATQGKAYRRAPKQEKDKAARLGGSPIRGSGRGFKKGDIAIPDIVRIECKNTQAASFRVTQAMVKTVRDAGMASGQLPVISVEFLDARGKVEMAVSIIEDKALEALLNRLRDNAPST